MKKLLLICMIALVQIPLSAQNVGIGIKNPAVKLDVSGGFRVSAEYITPVNPPGASQTVTMVNAITNYVYTTDSAYRIYDPSGPSANYIANLNASLVINDTDAITNQSFELIIENINLGTGDSLIIYSGANISSPVLYKAGNNFTGSNIVISTPNAYCYCIFKANGDASVGSGFSLLAKKKYLNTNTPSAESGGILGLLFSPSTAVFRTGKIAIGEMGAYSTGMGYQALATGIASFAMGSSTEASGGNAVAMGNNTIASGSYSTALGFHSSASNAYCFSSGYSTEASGFSTVAIGYDTKAFGSYSTAIGRQSEASGANSIALGYSTKATGLSSTAMGRLSEATGEYATAMGNNTTASGNYSTAMGRLTLAFGNHSTAFGRSSFANGENAVAMGYNVSASGDYSTAFGTNVAAASDYSIAMGRSVSTASNPGSFILGDNQTTLLSTTANNQMMMRFAGGYRLFSNAGATIGVSLAAGANSWASISDSTKKENYQPANATSFLSKISGMRLGSWNYKGQDKKTFRHYGPMAQDFYNNFGSDGIGTIGNDTTIAGADIDGVMMIAIQALVKENEKLKTRLEKLEAILIAQSSIAVKK